MKKKVLIFVLLFAGIAFVMPQNKLEDSKISDAIENEYRFDHAVNTNKINVVVTDGIVSLTGTVNNLKAKERATKIAELVKGVRSVSNRIDVVPSSELSDSELQYNVETALFRDPATDLYELEVSVTDNVVTLEGSVDSYQEKALSADVAKSVSGVVRLNNQIEIDYKTNRSDSEIKSDIEEALKWNVMVDDGLIDVDVKNGEVHLSGIVGSAAEKSTAFFTSWVSGVRSVDNKDLEVRWWASDEDLRKNKYTNISDENIKDAILDAARYDPRVFSFEFTPEVEQGWVTLRGTVDNLKAKISAEKLAENTTGVTGVTNRIKVQPDKWVSDSEIEKNIKKGLANNAITEPWEVKVDVNNGIATLSGVVDSYLEKTEAEWVAANETGVNEVNNQLSVHYPYGFYWWGYYPHYDLHFTPENSMSNLVPNDKKIARSVKSELWWSPYVDRDQVTVIVENGQVTLKGTVDSWKEYQKAAENAWQGGAWSVNNMLVVN